MAMRKAVLASFWINSSFALLDETEKLGKQDQYTVRRVSQDSGVATDQ